MSKRDTNKGKDPLEERLNLFISDRLNPNATKLIGKSKSLVNKFKTLNEEMKQLLQLENEVKVKEMLIASKRTEMVSLERRLKEKATIKLDLRNVAECYLLILKNNQDLINQRIDDVITKERQVGQKETILRQVKAASHLNHKMRKQIKGESLRVIQNDLFCIERSESQKNRVLTKESEFSIQRVETKPNKPFQSDLEILLQEQKERTKQNANTKNATKAANATNAVNSLKYSKLDQVSEKDGFKVANPSNVTLPAKYNKKTYKLETDKPNEIVDKLHSKGVVKNSNGIDKGTWKSVDDKLQIGNADAEVSKLETDKPNVAEHSITDNRIYTNKRENKPSWGKSSENKHSTANALADNLKDRDKKIKVQPLDKTKVSKNEKNEQTTKQNKISQSKIEPAHLITSPRDTKMPEKKNELIKAKETEMALPSNVKQDLKEDVPFLILKDLASNFACEHLDPIQNKALQRFNEELILKDKLKVELEEEDKRKSLKFVETMLDEALEVAAKLKQENEVEEKLRSEYRLAQEDKANKEKENLAILKTARQTSIGESNNLSEEENESITEKETTANRYNSTEKKEPQKYVIRSSILGRRADTLKEPNTRIKMEHADSISSVGEVNNANKNTQILNLNENTQRRDVHTTNLDYLSKSSNNSRTRMATDNATFYPPEDLSSSDEEVSSDKMKYYEEYVKKMQDMAQESKQIESNMKQFANTMQHYLNAGQNSDVFSA